MVVRERLGEMRTHSVPYGFHLGFGELPHDTVVVADVFHHDGFVQSSADRRLRVP